MARRYSSGFGTLMEVTLKARPSQATIYKYGRATSHIAESDPQGMVAPQYRGFTIRCEAAELPARQRAIDAFWSKAYYEAQSPVGRDAVIAQERKWRDAPREWT
jgi:hypothetical protein